jgi:MoxR-like ATPase
MNNRRRLSQLARSQQAEARASAAAPKGRLEELAGAFSLLVENISRVIVGKDDVIRLVAAAMISRGHVLLEDIPGVGKTTLAKAIARSIAASYSRVQFTPDLLPSDITGSSIYSPKDERFYWSPGPLFANIVLADEINRTSPRTQAALLEAMEEQHVTVEGETHQLPSPFFVIATQNPHELHGTFPLPEGQTDRFLVSISLGLPGRMSEERMVREQLVVHPLERLEPVVDIHQIVQLQTAARQIRVSDAVLGYIMDIIEGTRSHDEITLGASPRASLALVHTCQSLAFVNGRSYVIPDDVQTAAVPVLSHRLVLATGPSRKNGEAAQLVSDIVAATRVPV